MTELKLNRVDYMQAGITSPNCLRLIPPLKKEMTSKVAVADNGGIVHVFGMKKKEIQTVFKTLPGPAVTRLELGGPPGQQRDRLFVSSGAVVRGFSKKGKQFLDFNTNITESIKNMYVEGADLFISGDYIYHHYRDCKDTNYFLCEDRINDLICLPTDKAPDLTVVLACNDGMLRIFQESEQVKMNVLRSPQTLCLYENDGGDLGNKLIYGTQDGRMGLVQVNRFMQENLWELENEGRSGGIRCLSNFDITGNGILDLLVGRDDGQVEVYEMTDTDEPVKRFSHTCSESVTSVQGGHVASPDYSELVISTYAGWVMGLTTESVEKGFGTHRASSVNQDNSTVDKLEALRREVEELQRRVQREREQYQATSQNSNRISAIPKFNINDKFMLNKEDGCYLLSIEVHTAIDNVLIQSNVILDILDVNTNSAVISLSNCDPRDSNCVLATYRCQANTTRMELKLRTIEGQHGTVLAYVTPKLQPKVCQVKQYEIKPLSLHCRAHSIDESRPLNRLSLLGTFSMAEIHSWISFCLNDVPERTPAGDSATFYFASTLLDTVLECFYKRGEVHFRSDSITTISILKDVLTKKATEKGIRLELTYDINDESIPHILRLLDPKLQYQMSLAKKVHMLDALKEVQVHEGNDQVLTEEYRQVLREADKLKAEFSRQPWHLERLHGMIADIYIDSYQFKGQDMRKNVDQLMAVLKDYNLHDLLEFFHLPVSG